MKSKVQRVNTSDPLKPPKRDTREYDAETLLKLQRDLAYELTAQGSFMETLGRILIAGCRIDDIDCGGIYLVDAARRELELVCHRGLSPAFVESQSRFTAKARQTALILNGRALYFNAGQITAMGMTAVWQEGIRALAVVPVRHDEHVVAVLNLASRTVDEIDENIRSVIETIAAQIGPTVARVQAESAVLASERNFQSLFSSIEDFLFISDQTGLLVHMNPVAERRLGYSSAEVRGKPLTVLHPRAQRREAEATIKAMLAGKTDTCYIPLQAKDGSLIEVETRVVRGEWNGKLALFGISRDVTERRRVERELMERQRQLHNLVSQLGVAEETERRRIAHGIHDDIGQLLAISKMQLDGLMSQAKGSVWCGQIEEVRQHIIRLLQVSRSLTFDLASPVLQRFGLKSAVEDLCEKMTERHKVLFSVRATPAVIPLSTAGEILVFQAIRELLHNIVKHAKARHAWVILHRAGKKLVVTVKDDGIGFGKARVTASGKDGLGLHAIRERMNHLGGSFVHESLKPHGARVSIAIPLESAGRAEGVRGKGSAPGRSRPAAAGKSRG